MKISKILIASLSPLLGTNRKMFSCASHISMYMSLLCITLIGSAPAYAVIPDFYEEPGIMSGRDYLHQSDNEYIDPFSGLLNLHYVDIDIPGNGGLDLKVQRAYTSRGYMAESIFGFRSVNGVGWTLHFGRVVKPSDNVCAGDVTGNILDNPVIELPDGSRHILYYARSIDPAGPLYITSDRWKADCAPNGDGLIVTSPEGVRYTMLQKRDTFAWGAREFSWYATEIRDLNNNVIWVGYRNDSGQLGYVLIDNVTTSDGRTLVFSYVDEGTYDVRLSSITARHGTNAADWVTYQYVYNQVLNSIGNPINGNYWHLTQVLRPDGKSWVYEYNPIDASLSPGYHSLRKVTNPYGGVTNYTYQYVEFDNNLYNPASVSLLQKTTAGPNVTPGTWTYSYAPGSGVGALDVTTVTTPDGTYIFRHFGYLAATDGSLWKIGLLMEKEIVGLQKETFVWNSQQLSTEEQFRMAASSYFLRDYGCFVPILANKTVIRDGATYGTTYSNFDVYGNPKTIAESGPDVIAPTGRSSRTTNLTYNVNVANWVLRQVKDEIVVGGRATTRLFDPNHNLTSISVDGVTTSHTYNPDGIVNGTIASTTFPSVQIQGGGSQRPIHYYRNYKRGIPQLENQPEGISISRVVSDAGNVTSQTNGRNFATGYSYDGLNRLKTITYPADPTSQAGHDPVNIDYAPSTINTPASKTVTRGTGANALIEKTIYDGFGRPTNVTLGGVQTAYSYDALGRMTFKSNPDIVTPTLGTTYTYDALDRIKTITYADHNTIGYTYGAATTSVKDERNYTTTYGYRAYGNPNQTYLMQITPPESSAKVTITRTTRDQIDTVKQGSLTRSYHYYPTGYLNTVTDPEIGTTTYGRDEAGNMTTREVGTSGQTVYTYDLQNRLTYVTYPGTTPLIHHTYTNTNKLKTVSAGASTRTLDYDATDNLISDALSIDGYNFNVGYGYNANDQLSSITYPQSGKTVSFSPDVLGRPTTATDTAAGGYASNVTYWPSGQVKQISYQNGTVSNYGQKPDRLWPDSFTTQKGAVTPYVNNRYDYDLAGNLKTIADTNTTDFNRSFDYDAINRLTTINGPWGQPSVIAYDGVGNIQSQTFGSSGLTYSYSPQNQLSAVSGTLRNASYTYDTSYGNIIADGAGKTYGYDDAPNLTSVNDSNTGTAITYAYDGLNKRTKVIKNGVTTYEFYDTTGKLLMEYTPGAHSKLLEYIYLGNMRIAQRQSYQ